MARQDEAIIRMPRQSDGSGRHGRSGYRQGSTGRLEVVDLRAGGELDASPIGGELSASTPVELEALKVPELRELAASRGLLTTGNKAELLARLG